MDNYLMLKLIRIITFRTLLMEGRTSINKGQVGADRQSINVLISNISHQI